MYARDYGERKRSQRANLFIVAIRVRTRLGVLVCAGIMVSAAACGSRTGLFEAQADLGSPDAAGDGTVGSDTGADAPSESGSDARTMDVNLADAGIDSGDASVDAIDAAGDRNDASDAKDGQAPDGDGGPADGPADAPSDACPVTQLFVDAVHGSDSADGSVATSYKSITKAITVAATDTCIATIFVSPGTYDLANGEVFPLRVPANVSLIGDEPSKGLPEAGPVFIVGAALVWEQGGATVYPGTNATVAGLEITAPTAPPDAGWVYPIEVFVSGPTAGVTVRNNTIVGSSAAAADGCTGIYLLNSPDNVVVGNVVKGNRVGLFNRGGVFDGGKASAKVESNVVTLNLYGVECDSPGADLGGGAFASAGLNALSCNTENLWLSISGQPAANNYWDHLPPTTTSINGGIADIFQPASWGLTAPTTIGAMLAAPNCP